MTTSELVAASSAVWIRLSGIRARSVRATRTVRVSKPVVVGHGAETFRSAGTADSPGTFLATVTGAGRDAAIYELPHGFSMRELLALHGVSAQGVHGALLGGYFNELTNERILDLSLDHEALRAGGTGLGCGAVALLTDQDCPVAVTASVLDCPVHAIIEMKPDDDLACSLWSDSGLLGLLDDSPDKWAAFVRSCAPTKECTVIERRPGHECAG